MHNQLPDNQLTYLITISIHKFGVSSTFSIRQTERDEEKGKKKDGRTRMKATTTDFIRDIKSKLQRERERKRISRTRFISYHKNQMFRIFFTYIESSICRPTKYLLLQDRKAENVRRNEKRGERDARATGRCGVGRHEWRSLSLITGKRIEIRHTQFRDPSVLAEWQINSATITDDQLHLSANSLPSSRRTWNIYPREDKRPREDGRRDAFAQERGCTNLKREKDWRGREKGGEKTVRLAGRPASSCRHDRSSTAARARLPRFLVVSACAQLATGKISAEARPRFRRRLLSSAAISSGEKNGAATATADPDRERPCFLYVYVYCVVIRRFFINNGSRKIPEKYREERWNVDCLVVDTSCLFLSI